MSVPDPVTTGVVVAGALQIAKQAQEFIAAATGHPGESLGAILGNLTRRRWQNAEKVVSKAHLTLSNIGIAPQEIPLNILQPALEAASLQEDEYLQDTWANLLANAADPREFTDIHPAFTTILKDLMPRDAQFLSNFYDAMYPSVPDSAFLHHQYSGYSEPELEMFYPGAGIAVPLDDPAADRIPFGGFLRMTLDTLERHNLVTKAYMSITPDSDVIPVGGTNPVIHNYEITSLGIAFVAACRAPKKSQTMDDD